MSEAQARLLKTTALISAIVGIALTVLALGGWIDLPVYLPLLLLVATAGLLIGASRGK